MEPQKKHLKPKKKNGRQDLEKKFVHGPYKRILTMCVKYRYITLSMGLVIIIICSGLWFGHIIKFTFFPKVEGETMICSVTMPPGTPISRTEKKL